MTAPRTTALRALLALLLLAAPAATAAAEPTIGASLGASDAEVRIVSRASVPTSVELSLSEGWSVETTSFLLDPDEARNVAVTARGPDPGIVTATMRAVEVFSGTEASSLVLATGMAPPPAPVWPLLLLALLSTLTCAAVLALGYRRYRHAV